MVLIDDDDDPATKAAAAARPRVITSGAAGPSQAPPVDWPPPPYTPRTPVEADPLLPSHASISSSRSSSRSRRQTRRKKSLKKFAQHCFMACVIWLVITTLVWAWNYSHRKIRVPRDSLPDDRPPPPDVPPYSCRPASAWTRTIVDRSEGQPAFYADESFLLPADAASLYFSSNISGNSTGDFEITSDTSYPGKDVKYEVRAMHTRRDVLDRAVLCRRNDGKGRYGIELLFLPGPQPDLDDGGIYFDVGVKLPNNFGHKDTPRYYPSLEVDMPSFAQTLGDLGDVVHFGNITLLATETPIVVESLSATRATMTTNNAELRGVFNISSSLALSTSFAPLYVTVELTSNDEGNEKRAPPAEVSLTNNNGSIAAQVTLLSRPHHPGFFKLAAQTQNAPIAIQVPAIPVDGLLRLATQSTHALVRVSLPLIYEGSFVLQGAGVAVFYDENAPDPTGESRSRDVAQVAFPRVIRGRTEWIPEHAGAERGEVRLKSANGTVQLHM